MTNSTDLYTTSDRRDRKRSGTVVWLVGVIVASLIIGATVGTIIGLSRDVDTLREQANEQDDHAQARDADVAILREQLQSFGIEPKVDGPVAGQVGADGRDGRDGKDGKDGRDGRDGADAAPAQAGANGQDGASGPAGLNGLNGVDGRDGESIVGPQGPPGETVIGPQGEPGPQGPQGFEGPAPLSLIIDGTVCTDPDGDLHYECTVG